MRILADVPPPFQAGSFSPHFSVWLTYFVLTLLIELSCLALIWRWRLRATSLQRWLGVALVANVITHPLASFVWHGVMVRSGFEPSGVSELLIAYGVLELAVFAVEAVVYRKLMKSSWREAWLVAGICNGVSAVVGACIQFGNM